MVLLCCYSSNTSGDREGTINVNILIVITLVLLIAKISLLLWLLCEVCHKYFMKTQLERRVGERLLDILASTGIWPVTLYYYWWQYYCAPATKYLPPPSSTLSSICFHCSLNTAATYCLICWTETHRLEVHVSASDMREVISTDISYRTMDRNVI